MLRKLINRLRKKELPYFGSPQHMYDIHMGIINDPEKMEHIFGGALRSMTVDLGDGRKPIVIYDRDGRYTTKKEGA